MGLSTIGAPSRMNVQASFIRPQTPHHRATVKTMATLDPKPVSRPSFAIIKSLKLNLFKPLQLTAEEPDTFAKSPLARPETLLLDILERNMEKPVTVETPIADVLEKSTLDRQERTKENNHKPDTDKAVKTGKQVPESGAQPRLTRKTSISEKPKPRTGLSLEEAENLASYAIAKKRLPERKVLMAKIKTPWDIVVSDRAIVKALEAANKGKSPEEIKQNHMRALFLRDKIGQCVINHAMTTWHGKKVIIAYVFKVFPQEMKPILPAVRSLEGDGKLAREDARILAESFIFNQPLDHKHEALEKVIGFKDLVVLEEEAIRALKTANAQSCTDEERDQNAMNMLFLMHDVGTQTANRIMTTRADRYAYFRHLFMS